MKKVINLCVFDDHPIVIEGVKSILSKCEDIEVVGVGQTIDTIVDTAVMNNADVVLLDLVMPYASNSSEISTMHAHEIIQALENKNIKIIVFSSKIVRQIVKKLIEGGISGYIYKGDDLSLNIPNAVRMVYESGIYFSESIHMVLSSHMEEQTNLALTKRQCDIAEFFVLNPERSIQDAAKVFFVAEVTIKKHLTDVYKRLNISGSNKRQKLIATCKRIGLFDFAMR